MGLQNHLCELCINKMVIYEHEELSQMIWEEVQWRIFAIVEPDYNGVTIKNLGLYIPSSLL